eukprot:m.279860 g.279860  ORF g.279860 m.279860 type:complete len:186 (-) comp16323_c11_seq72:496-1053(-)
MVRRRRRKSSTNELQNPHEPDKREVDEDTSKTTTKAGLETTATSETQNWLGVIDASIAGLLITAFLLQIFLARMTSPIVRAEVEPIDEPLAVVWQRMVMDALFYRGIGPSLALAIAVASSAITVMTFLEIEDEISALVGKGLFIFVVTIVWLGMGEYSPVANDISDEVHVHPNLMKLPVMQNRTG